LEKTLIFGHQKPDTDSVTSSIVLSYLKNHLGEDTEPRVLGNINNETKFVLNYFNVDAPRYLNDVRIQIKDVDYIKDCFLNENDSIFKGYQYMNETKIGTIPVIDDNGCYKGAVSMKDAISSLISGKIGWLHTSYDNLLEALNAKEILRFDKEIEGNIYSPSYRSATFKEQVKIDKDSVLIVGDRHSIIEYAVNSSASIIILTNGVEMKPEHLEIAKKNHVDVISTNYDGLTTANLVVLSNYIKDKIKNEKIISVNENDALYDVLEMANKKKFSNYPILNNDGKCLGIFRLSIADNNNPKKVILVDHTDFNQTAIGIEEAEITEIIDHHNLSAIGTKVPIDVRTKPVGSTCTIIYKMFRERNIDIPRDIAGVMLSAILSDTMIFKSPTATPEDIEVANNLAVIAGVDVNDYGYKMFKAASSIEGMSVADLINIDFKGYNVGNSQIAISQVFTMDYEEIEKNLDEYLDKLDEISKNYICVVSFITDVYKNGSYILYNRAASEIVKDALNLDEVYPGVYIPDLVSRKKQMLPALLEVIEKRV